jgi:hypothetical protein
VSYEDVGSREMYDSMEGRGRLRNDGHSGGQSSGEELGMSIQNLPDKQSTRLELRIPGSAGSKDQKHETRSAKNFKVKRIGCRVYQQSKRDWHGHCTRATQGKGRENYPPFPKRHVSL